MNNEGWSEVEAKAYEHRSAECACAHKRARVVVRLGDAAERGVDVRRRREVREALAQIERLRLDCELPELHPTHIA